MSGEFVIITQFAIDTSNQILFKPLNQTECHTLSTYLDQKIITVLNSQLSTSHVEKITWKISIEMILWIFNVKGITSIFASVCTLSLTSTCVKNIKVLFIFIFFSREKHVKVICDLNTNEMHADILQIFLFQHFKVDFFIFR